MYSCCSEQFLVCFTLQIVLKHSEHPPLMKGTSWTLAAPYKEQKHHRTPSESIANNYTPSASDLKLKDLSKIRPPRIVSKGWWLQILPRLRFFKTLTVSEKKKQAKPTRPQTFRNLSFVFVSRKWCRQEKNNSFAEQARRQTADAHVECDDESHHA